jgi:hypothetical protein
MSEVSCKACSAFLRALAEYQISPERLVEGLPVTPAYLQNPANRISLDTYIAISRQFAALIEGVSPEAPIFAPTPQWQSVLDNIEIAITTVSPEGKILYANRAQQRFNRDGQEGEFIYEYFPEAYHQPGAADDRLGAECVVSRLVGQRSHLLQYQRPAHSP